jgi:hypothetical protein
MFVLFDIIFELIKISFLGCIYATLTLFTFILIGRYNPNSWFDRISKKKLRIWFLSGLIISTGLFSFMFTYWGDHGIGDWARIPLGHWKEVVQVDGTRGLIQNTNYGIGSGIGLEKFQITNDFLCGKTQVSLSKYPGDYIVYSLETNDVTFFKDKNGYDTYANKNQLPLETHFKDFNYHYKRYWKGWRFWILA